MSLLDKIPRHLLERAAAMIMTPAKIVARENHGRRMRQAWRGIREAM